MTREGSRTNVGDDNGQGDDDPGHDVGDDHGGTGPTTADHSCPVAQSAWGRGLGGELIGGLVGWCRAQAPIRSLAAGVAAENLVSAWVLEKNGFSAVETEHGDPASERLFELRLAGCSSIPNDPSETRSSGDVSSQSA